MLGLIYKDFVVLKRSLCFFGLWFLVFGIFCGFFSSVDFFCGAISVFAAILPLTTLSYDSQCDWEAYALTLPISRRSLALSRYLFTLVLTLAAALCNLILRVFLANDGSFLHTLAVVGAIAGISLLTAAVMLPLVYKFGVEKGRLFLIFAVFLAVSIPILIKDTFHFSAANFLIQHFYWLMPFGSIICFLLSMAVSAGIYAKKDF